jgi:nucleotide-binding universal stress UspA family protein
MALKDLLVHVHSESFSGPMVDAALALAERHDTHLVGLGIRAPADMPTYAEARLPESVIEILDEREATRLSEAEAMFTSRAKHAGREDRVEWREAAGLPAQTLSLHARYADLVVAAQSPQDSSDRRFVDLAEDVLIAAGRPVLVVPSTGARAPIGDKVIVAWNGSREAARALGDAMPLLDKAASVEIFIAGDPNIGDLPGADVGAHLARHNIRVDIHRAPSDEVSVGDALLNRVSDAGADMVVMGGYGRSRFREFVLGGVTRHILQHLTVPVMMSH